MKENIFLMFFAIILSFFAFLAVAATHGHVDPTMNQKAGKILETMIVINQNEINLGREAAQKSANPQVKNFAETMIRDHSKNLQAIEAFSKKTHITPISSEKIEVLKKLGNAEMKDLASKRGNNFDNAYITAMVKGHSKVLKIIDEKLLPNASNPELIKYLSATKNAVTQHLKMAKEVQKSLKS